MKRLRPLLTVPVISLTTLSLLTGVPQAQEANVGPASAPVASRIELPLPPEISTIVERDLAAQARAGASTIAIIERMVEAPVRIDLPPPAEDFVSFERMDGLASPLLKAETARPIELPLPEPPQVSFERMNPPVDTSPVVAAEPKIDLPLPPEVVVVIDVPASKASIGETPALAPQGSVARLASLSLTEDSLRDLLEPYRHRLKLKPEMLTSIVSAYEARGWTAFWLTGEGTVTPAVAALRAVLAEADADGLDSRRLTALLPQVTDPVAPERQAETDLALSIAAWLYAHDARGGRVDPRSLSALLTPKLSIPAPAEVLLALDVAGTEGVTRVLTGYQPKHAGYRALRAELKRLREKRDAEVIQTSSVGGGSDSPLPEFRAFMGNAPLRLGQRDDRVVALRARLRLPPSEDSRYTGDVVDAVKLFQRANDLPANGRMTPRTRALLDTPRAPVTPAERKADPDRLIATVIANMERWRWLPSELGKTHIFVNIPDYRLEMMDGSERIFETRVIVGKPETQTPVFSDKMEFLIVNPSWYVPPSILKKEFLPRLASDPEYASKRGYEVIRRGNAVSVRQPPGERNALGYIKFMFPNDHAVYLHDTPTRHLFARDARAFSHGCVRVEGPFRLAERVLRQSLGLSEKELRAMIGRGERTLKLSEHIPVHLAYFTVDVDEAGQLRSRNDIYGHDARLRKALSL